MNNQYRVVVLVTATAAMVGFFAPGAADADAFVPLPDGVIEGDGVRITSVGERALISPSLAANGAGRSAWVSGNITVDVTTPPGEIGPNNGARNFPGSNDSSTHGASGLTVGYIVGCQVQLAALSSTIGLSLNNFVPGVAGGVSIPISAGQVKWVQINNIDMTRSGTYHMTYQDFAMDVQNCAGYAQARQFAVVEIIGTDYTKTTLYGQPFSIG